MSFDPTFTAFALSGLTGGFPYTNNTVTMNIQCKNTSNQNMTTSPGNINIWDISCTGPENFGIDITDNNNGTMTATFTFSVVGNYTLIVKAQSLHLIGSPMSLTVKGAYAPNCTATGSAVSGGLVFHVLTATIQAKDQNGDNVPVGGDDINATVYRPIFTGITCGVTDNNNGTYTLSYIPLLPGEYTVNIYVETDDILGSPFSPVNTLL